MMIDIDFQNGELGMFITGIFGFGFHHFHRIRNILSYFLYFITVQKVIYMITGTY